MTKTLVGVNTLESVSSFVYSSHCKLWLEMRKQFPEDEFLFYTPYRMSIDNMRNGAARIALEHKCDYLMFIDDDVVVRPDTYKSLREANKDIVMALTYVRGYPFHPMFFRDFESREMHDGKIRLDLAFHDEDFWEVGDDGLIKTGAVGFSCVLINCDVLRAMTPPYFVTGPGHTEDVYFCLKARAELEPEPTIYVDTKVPTGHILMPDMVSKDNVEKLREYYKPDFGPGAGAEGREFKYLDSVKEELQNA